MRRMLLAAFVAATLGVPGAAFAVMTVGGNGASGMRTNTAQGDMQQQIRDRMPRPHDISANGWGPAIGAGMDAGNIDGHTTGPGNAPIDNSVRGPINDVQPGHGTSDTPQNRAPKPVRELPRY